MRFPVLVGLIALGALPLSAHPRVFVRGGFWWPRPILFVRPAPVCLEPAPVLVYRHERMCHAERYYRHGWRRHW
jgi:hypothetical protein